MPTPTSLDLHHLFELGIDFEPVPIYASPLGTRLDAIVRRGAAKGPRLDGEVLPGGGDWIVVGADGIARLDIRATIRTHDAETIHVTGTGRVVVDDDTRGRFLAGETIAADEMYARIAPLFETGADAYRWLNGTVATGLVLELSLQHVRYQVYALA